MLDLYQATRDDLIRLIHAQQDALAAQDQRLAALEVQLTQAQAMIAQLTTSVGALVTAGADDDAPGPGTPGSMPGLKATEAPVRERRPRRNRAHGAGRHRMMPTARVVHALAACPACRAPLAGGTIKRTREVIEAPSPQVVVTEHVYLERRCPDCGHRCVPAPGLAGIVPGHGRLGNRLVSLIAVLREAGRLPFATIQTLLQTLYGVTVSVGALVGATHRVARAGTAAVTDLRTAIRASPVVHADETGWREDGHNGYVWTFSTPDTRLFVRDTREKRVLTETVGATLSGVLVSDFYGAYTGYDGRHQYCWAHLLRDVHDLVTAHPRDAGVRGWAAAVHAVFDRAKAVTGDGATRRQAAQTLQAELAALCAPYLPPAAKEEEGEEDATATAATAPTAPVPPQRPLCQRIMRHRADLFVFVADPTVPATNNGSERSLRPLVVCRKISGGTRSDAGSATKMTLASVFATWRAQGLNPFAECRRLLANPQP